MNWEVFHSLFWRKLYRIRVYSERMRDWIFFFFAAFKCNVQGNFFNEFVICVFSNNLLLSWRRKGEILVEFPLLLWPPFLSFRSVPQWILLSDCFCEYQVEVVGHSAFFVQFVTCSSWNTLGGFVSLLFW